MFGKLLFDVVLFYEFIVMVMIVGIILGGLAFVGLIIYFGKWIYLWKEWLIFVDYKCFGIMYIIVVIVMLLCGFVDVIMMCSQQVFVLVGEVGFLLFYYYDQIFIVYGVIMIFFVVMFFVIGLMNLVVLLQIGVCDVVFLFFNNLSFWFIVVGVILVNVFFGVGEFVQIGWLVYLLLLGIEYSLGVGVDYWIWSFQLFGIGMMFIGINFFVIILKMCVLGMIMFKMLVFIWVLLCVNVLIIVFFLILMVIVVLLILDCYLGIYFFINDMGGNMMMYINLIWVWGYLEVYILILFVFGVFFEIVVIFLCKCLFGYILLVWVIVCIIVLLFIVWLYYFFMMGVGVNVNVFFGIIIMIIVILIGVKIFNWLFIMYQGCIVFYFVMLWIIGFIVIFLVGGMIGVLLVVLGVDFVLYNSLFLIVYFYNVIIGGVVFGCFVGMIYWWFKVFGFKLNEIWGKCVFWFWIIGFFVVFMLLYVLGFMGMICCLSQQIDLQFYIMLMIVVSGVVLIVLGIFCFVIQMYVFICDCDQNCDLIGDLWGGCMLEWVIFFLFLFYNFVVVLYVYECDVFWEMKEKGEVYKKFDYYEEIYMLKNSGVGIVIVVFFIIFGFVMIWYIWWLVIVGFVGMIIIWIVKSFDEDVDYYVLVVEIEKLENQYFDEIIKVGLKNGN